MSYDPIDLRNQYLLLLFAATLAGLAGCSRVNTPITLDTQSMKEREQLVHQALQHQDPATRFKEWHNERGERIGARVGVINISARNSQPCKEYSLDTWTTRSGHQLSERVRHTVCLDPETNTWVTKD